MPAISVRDIAVKDDPTCMCSDLVAGTHGRGFWILDNVTPLRQAAEAAAAAKAYLFKPATAIRIRFDTNDPTPWPPEWPAGENPPYGAVIDYNLPSGANEVKLEILDAKGNTVRSYSSSDAVRRPNPAQDPAGYDQLCRQNPTAPDCALPLYWPAPPIVLKTGAGMHRFSWDMRHDPIPGTTSGARGGEGESGAVPGRTYPAVNAPWVAPGPYTVRLTVDGQAMTQPIVVKLDPRVKVTPEVQKIFTLTAQAEDRARTAATAYREARAMLDKLKAAPETSSALIQQLEALAPEPAPPVEGRRRGFGAPPEPPAPMTLANAAGQLVSAVMPMQGSEMAPTMAQLEACARQEASYAAVMAKWSALKAKAGRGSSAPASAAR